MALQRYTFIPLETPLDLLLHDGDEFTVTAYFTNTAVNVEAELADWSGVHPVGIHPEGYSVGPGYFIDGQVYTLTWNAAMGKFMVPGPAGAVGEDTFLGLADTPDEYTTHAGEMVVVKGDMSGLEFIPIPNPAVTFLELTDTPDDYAGQGGKFVMVNASMTALEFVVPPSGGGGGGDLPPGGSIGQYLAKLSATDFHVGWSTPPVPPGGTANQVLSKINNTDFNTQWTTLPAVITDHGALGGLADDDHPQYLTQARADLRYYTEAEINALIAAVPNYWTLSGDVMYSNNAGNVGIGTSTPAYKLQVAGSLAASSLVLPQPTTGGASIEVGAGRAGNGVSYIDLIGDATYSDYGLRIIRNNAGPNTISQILHRGTGELAINAQDAAPLALYTSGLDRLRVSSGGTVTLANLAGTGNRMVVASAAGLLSTQAIPSAPAVLVPHYSTGTIASPTLSGASGVTYVSGGRFVRWTRIGDVVYLYGRVAWASLTPSATGAKILLGTTIPGPTTSDNYHTIEWGLSEGIDMNVNTQHNMLRADDSGGNTYLELWAIQGTTDFGAQYTYNSFQSAGFIDFTGHYFTNDPA